MRNNGLKTDAAAEIRELKDKREKLEAQLTDATSRRDAAERRSEDWQFFNSEVHRLSGLIHDINDELKDLRRQQQPAAAAAAGGSPKRGRDDGAWRLSARITRGAGFMNMRRHLFQLAEDHTAFKKDDRCIVYSPPVTGDSDLVCELYFYNVQQARNVETVIMQAVRDRWKSGTLPVVTVEHDPATNINDLRRVFSHHYDRSTLPPDRDGWEHRAVDDSSHATTVTDAVEIARESVVDSSKVDLKFELCHIDASIKGSRGDTTGNHIPLPLHWHRCFDAHTTDGVAHISIVAAPGEEGKAAAEADGRSPVRVHVYFHPAARGTRLFMSELRNATHVRPNVYEVTVWKMEAEKFVGKLKGRHDEVTQKWSAVP